MLLLTALGRIIFCLSQFLVLIPTRVPGLPQSEAKQKSQARLYSSPSYSRRENKQQVPLLLAPEGLSLLLIEVRGGVCSGAGPEGWLRWFAHPFGGGVCRGHTQYHGTLHLF